MTYGLIRAFLGWPHIRLALGKRRDVPAVLYIIDAFAVLAIGLK